MEPGASRELPKFVHQGFSKDRLIALQRLETPVIYFHSSQPLKVDVNVRFLKGRITEWYPNVAPNENPFEEMFGLNALTWKNLAVLADSSQRPDGLPQDNSGSHYFAAREAGSQWLHTDGPGAGEVEKFIFYRGAGSFETPLRASVNAADAVQVENSGAQKLSGLFLIRIEDGRGSFTEMKSLPAHSSPKTFSGANRAGLPLAKFQEKIAARVASVLAGEGLFSDEARAMVDTWKDSWFTEEGERVLYILPRAWTDEILPLTLSPTPEKLVRVMVGRAEILAPSRISRLRQTLRQADAGDKTARALADAELKALDRFAGPAMQLANPPGRPVAARNGI